MGSRGEIRKPDFAFPATVVKDAQKALKEADKQHDAVSAIEALIQIYYADAMIDNNKRTPKNIELVRKEAEKYKDNELYALFRFLEARFLSGYYMDDRWTYDQRESAPTLPKDISEWSGEQFRRRLTELVSIPDPAKLFDKALYVKDYERIIESDSLSQYYYPTLTDFCAGMACDILKECDESTAELTAAMCYPYPGQTEASLTAWNVLKGYDKVTEPLTEASALEIERFARSAYLPDDKEKAVKYLREYLAKYPESVMRGNLEYQLSKLTQGEVMLQFPDIASPEVDTEMTVDITNAKKVEVKIYYTGEKEVEEYKDLGKPIAVIPFENAQEAPFKYKASFTYKFNKPGYYAVTAEIPGVKNDQTYVRSLLSTPVLPIAIDGIMTPKVVVVNSHTGEGVEGAEVAIKNGRDKIGKSVKTNAIGVAAPMFDRNSRQYWNNIVVRSDGKTYNFEDLRLSPFEREDYTPELEATIFTDRALYHPGETIHAVIALGEAKVETGDVVTRNVVAGKELKVIFYDANREKIDVVSGKTDEMGRIVADFVIPDDGRFKGEYFISAGIDDSYYGGYGTKYVTVSDYKLPDFEIKDMQVERHADGSVTIEARTMMYSGFPVAGAKVEVKLSKLSWWQRFFGGKDYEFYQAEATTDEAGNIKVEIPAETFAGKSELVEANLEASSPTGTFASGSRIFSVGKPYYISIENMPKNVDAQQPFVPKVNVYDANGDEVKIDLEFSLRLEGEDEAKAIKPGETLKAFTPGAYVLQVAPRNAELADTAKRSFMIYNMSTNIVPGASLLWALKEQDQIPDDGRYRWQYGTTAEKTQVYYTVSVQDTLIDIRTIEVGRGYHTLPTVVIPSTASRATITMFTVQNCKTYKQQIELTRPPKQGPVLNIETFRDRLIPGTTERWRFTFDKNSAVVVDIYNRAMDALKANNQGFSFPNLRVNYSIDIRNAYQHKQNCFVSQDIDRSKYTRLTFPKFIEYMMDRDEMIVEYCLASQPMKSMSIREEKVCNDMAAPQNCITEDAIVAGAVEQDGGASQSADSGENFDYRQSELAMAMWAPMLTTDADGNLEVTFEVPNANTSWRMLAYAWNTSLETSQLVKDMVAAKPVMVQPNVPRFVRIGDNAEMRAMVMNNSDEDAHVRTIVEYFNPIDGKVLASEEFNETIAAGAASVVKTRLDVTADMPAAVGYRVRCYSGAYSDGEQTMIPVLQSVAQLVETQPFYLNEADTTLTLQLPTAADARVTLSYCATPEWSIVSALPGLRQHIYDDANSAAAAIFSAAIARGLLKEYPAVADAIRQWNENPGDSALVSRLSQNEDLKIAMLNATPWVEAAQSDTERMARLALMFDQSEVDKAIEHGIDMLKTVQKSDGGFGWCTWSDYSSMWVTGNVLAMMSDLKTRGWLPDDSRLEKLIAEALAYYDKEATGLYTKQGEYVDMPYAIFRPQFDNVPLSGKAQKALDSTVKQAVKTWKKQYDVGDKAIYAMAMWMNGKHKDARTALRSIGEFGVMTAQQGLTFPSVSSLVDYSLVLDAYMMIDPENKDVAGLRQQLIVRKQATDWGSAVVTTQVVAALIKAQGRFNRPGLPIPTITDLTGRTEYTITKDADGIAYGAVFAQYRQLMTDVKAFGCEDLTIEKSILADSLNVGDQVTVQLTIHCNRNLDYVTIIDERPAAFEPADQLPGWIFMEGCVAYRENNDSDTRFFIQSMRPGTYQMSYKMNVSHAGRYISGVATIQSQYAPEISAHSSGSMIEVK